MEKGAGVARLNVRGVERAAAHGQDVLDPADNVEPAAPHEAEVARAHVRPSRSAACERAALRAARARRDHRRIIQGGGARPGWSGVRRACARRAGVEPRGGGGLVQVREGVEVERGAHGLRGDFGQLPVAAGDRRARHPDLAHDARRQRLARIWVDDAHHLRHRQLRRQDAAADHLHARVVVGRLRVDTVGLLPTGTHCSVGQGGRHGDVAHPDALARDQ